MIGFHNIYWLTGKLDNEFDYQCQLFYNLSCQDNFHLFPAKGRGRGRPAAPKRAAAGKKKKASSETEEDEAEMSNSEDDAPPVKRANKESSGDEQDEEVEGSGVGVLCGQDKM